MRIRFVYLVVLKVEFILVEIIQHLSIRNVLGLAFILFELVFATITSYVSPGYVTDMKDEEDVEKTSLLNTSSKAPIQQGSKCKQCGVKRPLRSCHCTEYVFFLLQFPGVISALSDLITTISSLIIVSGTVTSISMYAFWSVELSLRALTFIQSLLHGTDFLSVFSSSFSVCSSY